MQQSNMTDIAAPGAKRERDEYVSSAENDASLLQLLRSGSLQNSAEQALVPDAQRPHKRQMIQPGAGTPLTWQKNLPAEQTARPGTSPGIVPSPVQGISRPLESQAAAQQAGSFGRFGPHNTTQQVAKTTLLSQQLRAALGQKAYTELRTNIASQQEMFVSHLSEMHRLALRQTQSVGACENTLALQAELVKLQAEQDNQSSSDNTVEQEDALMASGNDHSVPEQKASAGSSKADTTRTNDTPSGQVPSNGQMQSHSFPGMLQGPSSDAWNMYRQSYMNSMNSMNAYNQQSMQGWGLPMMPGSFPGSFPSPYRGFGGMPPPMDPMLAWYTLHYGQQYHQAMANQANAAAAKAQQEAQQNQNKGKQDTNHLSAGADKGSSKAPRWWQDPEKVFGLAADPNVLANHDFKIAARHRAQEKLRDRSEATSKPPTHKKRSKHSGDVVSEKGESFERPAKIASMPKSASKNASGKEVGSGNHKAGSGISAFKSLATKNGRKPPTRAESIGSEMSRSGADRDITHDADSSDLNYAAHGSKRSEHG